METAASFEARYAPSSYPAALTKSWVPHDVRDQVVDFVRRRISPPVLVLLFFFHFLAN
jgi:hypothetical protein